MCELTHRNQFTYCPKCKSLSFSHTKNFEKILNRGSIQRFDGYEHHYYKCNECKYEGEWYDFNHVKGLCGGILLSNKKPYSFKWLFTILEFLKDCIMSFHTVRYSVYDIAAMMLAASLTTEMHAPLWIIWLSTSLSLIVVRIIELTVKLMRK